MSEIALRDDTKQLARMETDLCQRVLDALTTAGLSSIVYGVFDLRELMRKITEDTQGRIVVGAAYMGCRPTTGQATRPNMGSAVPVAVEAGNVASQLEFLFTVMYVVPEDEVNSQRYPATEVMTAIRRGVVGKQMPISNSKATTSWQFVYERPEIDESEPTLLVYTQVWRLKLPLTSQ